MPAPGIGGGFLDSLVGAMLSEGARRAGILMRFAMLFLCLLAGPLGLRQYRRRFSAVSVRRFGGPGPTAPDILAWKANQICTGGYQVVQQETVRAEGGKQIVDMHLRCNPYSPSFDPMSLPAIF